MKPKHLLSSLLLCAATAFAAPLPEQQVPGETQWLIHLDMENFRQTTTGKYALQALVDSKLLEFGSTIRINFATDVNGLESVTFYGASLLFESGEAQNSGVAILRGTPQLIEVVRGAIAAAELETPEAVVVIESAAPRILFFKETGVYGSIVSDRTVVISKSLESLETHFATAAGDHPDIRGSELVDSLPSIDKGFFILGVAEGINTLRSLPSQARVLQMTEGVAFRMGENESLLSLAVSLRTDLPETANRVQQVLQGVLALLSLAQVEDEEMKVALSTVSVAAEDTTVRLSLVYPAEALVQTVKPIFARMVREGVPPEPPITESKTGEEASAERPSK